MGQPKGRPNDTRFFPLSPGHRIEINVIGGKTFNIEIPHRSMVNPPDLIAQALSGKLALRKLAGGETIKVRITFNGMGPPWQTFQFPSKAAVLHEQVERQKFDVFWRGFENEKARVELQIPEGVKIPNEGSLEICCVDLGRERRLGYKDNWDNVSSTDGPVAQYGMKWFLGKTDTITRAVLNLVDVDTPYVFFYRFKSTDPWSQGSDPKWAPSTLRILNCTSNASPLHENQVDVLWSPREGNSIDFHPLTSISRVHGKNDANWNRLWPMSTVSSDFIRVRLGDCRMYHFLNLHKFDRQAPIAVVPDKSTVSFRITIPTVGPEERLEIQSMSCKNGEEEWRNCSYEVSVSELTQLECLDSGAPHTTYTLMGENFDLKTFYTFRYVIDGVKFSGAFYPPLRISS